MWGAFEEAFIEINKRLEYTGIEHRQTLRACSSIMICKLKLKIDNLKFENLTIGNLKWEIWKKIWSDKVGNF